MSVPDVLIVAESETTANHLLEQLSQRLGPGAAGAAPDRATLERHLAGGAGVFVVATLGPGGLTLGDLAEVLARRARLRGGGRTAPTPPGRDGDATLPGDADRLARLEGVMGALPSGVLVLDAEGRVRLANPRAEEYLSALGSRAGGRLPHRLGGVDLAELFPSGEAEWAWRELASPGSPRRTFEARAEVLAGGAASDSVLILREVTAQRELHRRAERQERLAAVGQLASGIAHDFNNILMAILGQAELLASRPRLPRRVTASLETIIDQGLRAAQLVRRILDFARRTPVPRQPTDLASLVEGVVKLLRRTFPENIRIHSTCSPPGEYWVDAVPDQLEAVLMNLAVNARDAMAAGGELGVGLGRLEVAAARRPPVPALAPGPWVLLTVSDTSPGIAPEHQSHLFEPFFTTKPPGQGTGLGLAQVYGLVRQHGGYVDFETSAGRGTTFSVYLPARAARPQAAAPAEPGAVPRGGGEVVLVVEDQPAVLGTLTAMLQTLGYRVLTAAGGDEALERVAAAEEPVSVVLTDWVMPGGGGEELVRKLRERECRVPVIAMSGYPLGTPPLLAGVLQKPVPYTALAQALHRALRGPAEASGNPTPRGRP